MVFASFPLAAALDKMSKNTLADLVMNLARGALGEAADEAAIVDYLQPFVSATMRARKDSPLSLAATIKEIEARFPRTSPDSTSSAE
jgi:hypothetical protein